MVPASKKQVARYIVYLVDKLSPSSILQYINVIRILHLEKGYDNPLQSYYVTSLLQGIKREHAAPPAQKLPITPKILLAMYHVLDLSIPACITFWAAALIAFYSFFRKSTLLPKLGAFSPESDLCIGDLQKSPKGYLLTVKHTKTIQFRQKLLQIPLPLIPGSPLCPSRALTALLRQLAPFPPKTPLFSYPVRDTYRSLHHQSFSIALKSALNKAGYQASKYSGHSFRRGGASFAFSCGIPADLIKIQGDWSSDAYLRYLSSPVSQRQKLLDSVSSHIIKIK